MEPKDVHPHRESDFQRPKEVKSSIFPSQDRQKAFERISAVTTPQDEAIEHKKTIVKEIAEHNLLPVDTLRHHPTVYAGSHYDVEYPLALGCRRIIMVDPELKNADAAGEIGKRIHALIDEEPTRVQENVFTFNFDFGEGDEKVSIELVPKYYNPQEISTPFGSSPKIPEDQRYSIPEQTGMILGFQSHFAEIRQDDITKLVDRGIVLDNKGLAVHLDFSDDDYDEGGIISRNTIDAKYLFEHGLEMIKLNSEKGTNYTFLKKLPTSLDILPHTEENEHKERKAEPRSDLVAKYKLFDKVVNPAKGIVYHPCGADDCSPSVAFPDSRVVYVELDGQSVTALQKDGFEAHHASALDYDPGDVDILIMLNPQISPSIPASHIKAGGYAVVNDYHETATELRNNPNFRLRGLIRVAPDQSLIYDTERPEDYWQEIETDEELKNSPFDWGSVHYSNAAMIVEALTGKRENVLSEYKNIIAKAKEQKRKKNAELIAENPKMAEILVDPDQEDTLILNHEGRQFVLDTRLPRKKGTVDDLFIFEKIAKPSLQNSESSTHALPKQAE